MSDLAGPSPASGAALPRAAGPGDPFEPVPAPAGAGRATGAAHRLERLL